MIYREFRAHSIIFACRSFAVIAAVMTAPNSFWERAAASAIVLATIIAADAVTAYYRKLDTAQGSTMRDMPFPESTSSATRDRINMYYSISQVFATLVMIYNDMGGIERAFLVSFPIQMAAFLMTLVRKSIISAKAWHIAYAASLGLVYLHSIALAPVSPRNLMFWVSAVTFCTMRFRFHVDKYILWTFVIAARLMQ